MLTGGDLSIGDVERVAMAGATAGLGPVALEKIDAARALIERAVDSGTPTYGVNTGFGRFVDVAISREDTGRLQLNLLRSHACAVGEPFPVEVVRAAMLLRANALATGASGVRRETVELLLAMLNAGVHPVVPSRGSLGASGDLAPLAHLALPLVGEGVAEHDGRRMDGGEALRLAGLEPVALEAKEGLALINGTQFMAAIGALVLARAHRLVLIADLAAAQSVEAVRGSRTPFSPEIQALRPHPGQLASAANLFALLDGSQINESHRWCGRVQDAYSLRCSPQVHGACRDAIRYARSVVAIELNAATDNPLVFADRDEVLSNGNFHGEPVAIALDTLKIALAELAGISERRIERMVNPTMSEGLPPFLTEEGGLNSGFMIPGGREQGAVPPGLGRLDPDQRRPGGSRLDGRHRRRPRLAGMSQRRAGAGGGAAVRSPGTRLPGAAQPRPRHRGAARRAAPDIAAPGRRPLALGRDRGRGRTHP